MNDSSKDNLPEIKRERVGDSHIEESVDDKGRPMQTERFAEKEIEIVNLKKLAPFFFFCPDNNKILMIPISIQFSVHEFLQLAAQMSGNLEELLENIKKETQNKKSESPETGSPASSPPVTKGNETPDDSGSINGQGGNGGKDGSEGNQTPGN